MGIKEKGFADWVPTTFPDTVKVLGYTDKAHFDIVAIDVNPLLHTCMRNAENEVKFVKLFFAELDKCFRLAIPQSVIYLAVDGSPPLAKMKEQIRRRKSKAPSKIKHMDSSSITPGCTFQLRVTEYLHYYAARYLGSKHHMPSLKFIVDGAETPGEGEAKIMKYLSLHSKQISHRRAAIFSGDSDVVIQALLSQVDDVYVLRPGLGNFIAFSVQRLRASIVSQAGSVSTTKEESYNIIRDFCICVMFSGNDYIRKLRGGRLSKVWPAYRDFRRQAMKNSWKGRFLVDRFGSLDLEVLKELLTRVRRLTIRAPFKPDLSISLAMLGLSTTPRTDSAQIGQSTEASDEEEDDDDDEDLDLKSIAAEERSPSYTRHIPNYLESIMWTLHMYSTGTCSDITFIQVGSFLTIEQILTFIARDSTNCRRVVSPVNKDMDALVTILSTVTLLGTSKVDLIPRSFQKAFVLEELRLISHAMIHDAQLVEDSKRVQHLIYRMGILIVSSVDPTSQIVQLLMHRQAPVALSQVKARPAWAVSLHHLGTGHAEIWDGTSVQLPRLETDPTLFVRPATFDRDPGHFSKPVMSSATRSIQPEQWPFVARTPKHGKVPVSLVKRAQGRPRASAVHHLK